MERPGSRNQSPSCVSQYNVITSYRQNRRWETSVWAAQASSKAERQPWSTHWRKRRLTVRYDGAWTPSSPRTRIESSLLVGSTILASVNNLKTRSGTASPNPTAP
ncbi:MAG: hypothetical protein LBJ08_06805 [Bifidobacteriaceae bacterium]|nr:hypothetical protein [Bifidobacteriaceae bacterium]